MNVLNNSELGKKSAYENTYNPNLLFPLPRKPKREEIGILTNAIPFVGSDIWTHYEVSWLNLKGKPQVAIAKIEYGADTPNIIESKSMKLYFNSFNNFKLESKEELQDIIKNDLEKALEGNVSVNLVDLNENQNCKLTFTGFCLDNLDIECDEYLVNSQYLKTEGFFVRETLYSDLLKSNCLVTNQPDWGSVQIIYKGNKIDRVGLLKYIVSFRNHNEFHEQCIERIFMDILTKCQPEELTVYGRYTRRGGLDINPFRTNVEAYKPNKDYRLARQ